MNPYDFLGRTVRPPIGRPEKVTDVYASGPHVVFTLESGALVDGHHVTLVEGNDD